MRKVGRPHPDNPDICMLYVGLLALLFSTVNARQLHAANTSTDIFPFLSGSSLLETLSDFRQQLRPIGDGDGVLESLRPGWGRFWTGRLGQSSDNTRSGTSPQEVLGTCGAIKDDAFNQIQLALEIAFKYSIQDGYIDWGFMGAENETAACAGQNCAYTNPSSPYGLTVLPLAPNETAVVKLRSQTMPKFAHQDMIQRNGLQAFVSPSFPFGRVSNTLTNQQQSDASSTGEQVLPMDYARGALPASAAQAQGSASSWQLSPDEVVLVAGCLPPATASRYFAWTHYLHSEYNPQIQDWSSVFASMGDSIGVYLKPDEKGDLPSYGTRNRLNSSLPGTQTNSKDNNAGPAASRTPLLGGFGPRGLSAWLEGLRTSSVSTTQQASLQSTEAANTSAPGTPNLKNSTERSLWSGLRDMAASSSAVPILTPNQETVQPTAFSDPGELGTDPYGQFTIIIMTASQPAANAVKDILNPVLARLGLEGSINVLPIVMPFVDTAGLQSLDSYFMLLSRCILDPSQTGAFKSYLQSQPWRVWRLTDTGSMGVGLARWVTRLKHAGFNPATDTFPSARVVPRASPALQQSEEWLHPALNWLLRKVNTKLISQRKAVSWSIGATPALASAGVDWGIDCYTRRIDMCNGDNRDAQYVTSLPLVSLDRMSKIIYLVGINHVSTGLASYVNLAPSDPIQRLGLASWDDQEMRGTADVMMADGPYAGLSNLFYVVAYARNCTGVDYCKEIPVSGARSLPLSRSMLLLLRAYVNPVTGVGPDGYSMVHFRSVEAVSTSEALIRDQKALSLDTSAFADSPCKIALTSTAISCPQTMMGLVQPSRPLTTIAEAFGIPVSGNNGKAPVAGRVERTLDGSDCCNAAVNWSKEKCWCSQSGRALMNAFSPLPARTIMAGVGRLCGQPILSGVTQCLGS